MSVFPPGSSLRRAGVAAAALGLCAALAALPAPRTWARDISTMDPNEVQALQQRLTDAGCFHGGDTGALASAAKACPNQDPILRIETGMHVAPIRSVGVDPSCHFAVTGSDDKTIRLWSMPDGRPLRVERLAIGDGDEGRVSAVAVSPDGKLIAAGGWDAAFPVDQAHSIYLFDTATGQSLRRIGQMQNTIQRLAFSPDGTQIAAALNGSAGVHVLDVASGHEVMGDPDFTAPSEGIEYAPDGTLFATGYDGFLRRYSPDGQRTAKIALSRGRQAYAVAVDPSGTVLAVGFVDNNTVQFFSAKTMRSLGFADTRDVQYGDLGHAAFTADGQFLFAAGGGQRQFNGVWHRFVRAFGAGGVHAGQDVPAAFDTILDVTRCGSGIAFGAGDPAFGIVKPGRPAITLARGHAIDMREKTGTSFMVSPDATAVRLGLALADDTPVLIDLSAGQVVDSKQVPPDLRVPNEKGLPISNWLNLQGTKLGDTLLPAEPFDMTRAIAIRADNSGFVMSSDFYLQSFDATGKLRWRDAAPSVGWAANLAKNDNVIVAGFGDGTVRWYRWTDGKELLALFVDVPTRRFVAWTPSGYYMASPNAEDLIGWHVNRGWAQQADFFPASRFHDHFNRPDIVAKVLTTLDEDTAVKQADAESNKKEDAKPLITNLPPVIRILAPTGGTFGQGGLQVTYAIRSPSGLPVDRIDVLVDGVRQQDRGFNRVAQPGAGEATGVLNVHLPQRDVEVALVPHAGDLAGEAVKIKLAYAGEAPRGEDLLKPKLYAIVAGVSDYEDKSLKLGFAAKDAQDFGSALQAQNGRLYSGVEVKVITDKEATRNNLIRGLKWLQKQVTSRDVGVVFLAGHGVTDPQQGYWFLPVDATPEDLDVSALSQDDIKRTLNGLAGKALLFLDSCHSGQALSANGTKMRGTVDINKVVSDFSSADNGIVSFASSTGREVSQEREEWHNGAFTKALIEGLGGKADLLHHGTITLSELDVFVTNRVKELTDGEQHPVMTKPSTVPDYPLAIDAQ